MGDKKVRRGGALSPILIPNHSQHKAPHWETRVGRHPGEVKLPTCLPRYRRLRQKAIVRGEEGGPGGAGGSAIGGHSQLTRVVAAANHAAATTAAGCSLINKKGHCSGGVIYAPDDDCGIRGQTKNPV